VPATPLPFFLPSFSSSSFASFLNPSPSPRQRGDNFRLIRGFICPDCRLRSVRLRQNYTFDVNFFSKLDALISAWSAQLKSLNSAEVLLPTINGQGHRQRGGERGLLSGKKAFGNQQRWDSLTGGAAERPTAVREGRTIFKALLRDLGCPAAAERSP
jgi:hypothetical protein